MDEGRPHIEIMNEEEARRIAALITGFIQGTLSEKEWDDLDEWIAASDKNMQLFEQLTDEDRLTESVEWLRRIGARSAMQKADHRKTGYAFLQDPVRRIWVSVAAVILIISGAAYYKMAFAPKEKDIFVVEWPANDHMEPGNTSPALILAESRRIYLSSEADSSVWISPTIHARIEGKVLHYPKALNDRAESDWNILQTPAENDYGISLSDGTKVRLNAGSALRYPVSFDNGERVVELRGEAYFEVQEDKTRPFLVKCGNVTVRVTGTRFNIDAYPGEAEHRITLLEGGVEIQRSAERVRLLPNQQALIFTGKEIMVRDDARAEERVAWTRGLFAFHKAPIEEVMKQAAKWYGITVRYNGKIDQEFSGNIPRSSTLEEALQMLELSGEIRFVINGREVIVQP